MQITGLHLENLIFVSFMFGLTLNMLLLLTIYIINQVTRRFYGKNDRIDKAGIIQMTIILLLCFLPAFFMLFISKIHDVNAGLELLLLDDALPDRYKGAVSSVTEMIILLTVTLSFISTQLLIFIGQLFYIKHKKKGGKNYVKR